MRHTIVTVLLNRPTADGIADGTISLVLRRWDKPRAKPGGTQRTQAGTIRIESVTERPGDYRVTAAQARAAGYPDAASAPSPTPQRSPRGWRGGTPRPNRGRGSIWS